MSIFYYCIFKLYKGVIKKKQKGNVHIFVTPAPNKKLFVFTLIGYSNKLNTWVVGLQWKHQIGLIDKVIETLKGHYEDKFEIIDKLKCKVKGDEMEFSINLSEKGSNIKDDVTFSMLTEYSDKKSIVYSMEGNINLEKVKVEDKQIKTAEKTVSAKFKAFFERLFS